jgi:signal transduction histidine kinase
MFDAKPVSRPAISLEESDRGAEILFGLYGMVSLIVFTTYAFLAINWFRTPTLGGYLDPELTISTLSAGGDQVSPPTLQSGDQLITVDGIKIRSASVLQWALRRHEAGETIPVTVRTAEGDEARALVKLQASTRAERFRFFYLPYGLGVLYLIASLAFLRVRRPEASWRPLVLFTSAIAGVLAGLFEIHTLHSLTPLWILSLALATGAAFHLALVFPQESELVRRFPQVRWLGYIPAILLAGQSLGVFYGAGVWPAPTLHRAQGYALLLLGIGIGYFIVWNLWRRHAAISPITRARARVILSGSLVAFLPPAILLAWASYQPNHPAYPYLMAPLGVFPLTAGYSVLQYRLRHIDYILSRAFLYALLTLLISGGYAALVSGLSLVMGQPLGADNPFLIGLLVITLTLALSPLRDRLQRVVDQALFRGQSAFQGQVEAFKNDLTKSVELPVIVGKLNQYIEQSLQPTQTHIFVLDPLSDQYVATSDETGQPSSDIRFPLDSSLVQTLQRRAAPFFMDRAITMPRTLQSDWARMALLGAQLFIPLSGQHHLTGWLALGPRRSGEPYSDRDLTYLENLSNQSAMALERAQVVADLETRVHEMNVLTRVAQGVNITLAFDDILELIYAQTRQVISLDDFHILLKAGAAGVNFHAFYLEDNERLKNRENQPLADRQGLSGEVLRQRRGIITDEHGRECRERAVLPLAEGLHAWMGVPLNVGAETIGALSVGSRDPALIYTQEQGDFLQAIADQAAGAIAKARLLEETERRARQLATLNDVARGLSSTLELDPLLNQILHSAVELLNCAAGSLIMMDENTGEMVFEVTAGPVARDLLGKRLPPGTGLVGTVVDRGEPVIANDVHQQTGWFDTTDQQTGFFTQSILIVPLEVKGRILGVIEVINKRDGTPFSPDDQDLLTVFTGQAAVAIENARLYTLTDQALAARVDELSVMQRVDRELNTSLDIGHAMRITLDWALRQSDADAGFVGVVVESELRVTASRGYDPPLEVNHDWEEAAQIPALKRAIQSGAPQVDLQGDSQDTVHLLQDTQSQVAIPIRREGQAIAVILLESRLPEQFNEETLQFLARLSDHAAIAVSNAQLYAEVQQANIAKSDFVSFVSHELKTPMTSIKGYSDLLANGAVGPVNEAQANFLATIRSNVNRMATLVSDLTDISRIEAGRLRLEFSAVPMAEVVEEVIRSIRQQTEEKKQALRVELAPDLPPVWGDRIRLIQILTNLASNANKYTPKGGEIIIRAESSANRWDSEGAGMVVHLSIQDNGIGISQEDQRKIFQKFFRSEDQKAREVPGTGLGLSITKNLVEMQGGKIWFESVYREGTTFHFTVPVVEGV